MDYKEQFIEFIIKVEALKFGNFTLKSGRISPYFFNAGLFNTAERLVKLGQFYASAIVANNLRFDILFGPAYKGIPLAASTTIALYQNHHINTAYSFNRKELKHHGEGGNIVGAKLVGDVVIIDDVITAGTAIGEAVQIMRNKSVNIKGVIIALDRQERGYNNQSAVSEISKKYNLDVFSIINLDDISNYLASRDTTLKAKINNYRSQYGTQ